MTWAVAHPSNFASVVLINTGVLIGYRWHLVAKLHRVPVLGYLAALGGRIGFRPALALYEPGVPKDVIAGWQREYDWGTRRAMLRFYRQTPTSGGGRSAPEFGRLDRPALVIWGAGNRFVPVEQAELQRRSFPSAEIVVLDGSRHYSHLDSPDRVHDLVLPFLRRQLDETRAAVSARERDAAETPGSRAVDLAGQQGAASRSSGSRVAVLS